MWQQEVPGHAARTTGKVKGMAKDLKGKPKGDNKPKTRGKPEGKKARRT
ncbi:MAG: hypothetical protein R3E56_07410 [Burkholderiaceae bacterium]